MYLPKICGNIPSFYPSALAGCLLLSCSPEPRPGPEVRVFAHQLDECELPSGDARIELEALGDFDPSNRTSDSLTADARGAALTFPETTLGVRASLTSERSSERFVALGRIRRGHTLPLLLWPEHSACPLSSRTASYPAPGGGQGIGYSEFLGLVLLAGSDNATSSAVSAAMTFDTATGEVVVVPPGPGQMSRARAFPTVTAFGDRFLVSGGEDPTVVFDSGRRNLRDTAEVYDPQQRAFEDELVPLIVPRSRHGAIVLDNGDTALIGGITEAAGERAALPTIEVVSVATRLPEQRSQLAEARIDPAVVRLSDGRVLVAGGETLDGELVQSLEWLSPRLVADTVREFAARFDQAFVAMPGGAALAVGGCEAREGNPTECAPCSRGCPPEDGWDAFWISADGEILRFFLEHGAPRPELIQASDGAPLLVTDDASGRPSLLRFDPWARTFRTVNEDSATLPGPGLPVLALDPGAYVYVSESDGGARVFGRRFSTRNSFSHDSELVHVTHAGNSSWPLHLAPGEGHESVSGLVPGEHPESPWLLELAEGTTWVTDTSYADFQLTLELAPGGTPELLLNGRACSWPSEAVSKERTLEAVRQQRLVTLLSGDETAECTVDEQRVQLGFAAPQGDEPARLTRISLNRGDP